MFFEIISFKHSNKSKVTHANRLLIDRVKWLCACVMCWPHRVGVRVCHLAFIAVSFKVHATDFVLECFHTVALKKMRTTELTR